MPYFHAVLTIDHHNAHVLQFDAEHVQIEKVAEHMLFTRQHNSGVRTEHEFYAAVCYALVGINEIVVTGSHLALAAFRGYVEKHRAAVGKQIVGWETVDHPTDAQLVAFGRHYFIAHERGAASPPALA